MKWILILLCLSFLINLKAQRNVLSSGGDLNSNHGSVSFSIGEIFYTSKGLSYNMTEGLQHGFVINPIYTRVRLHISIYPNPTSDLVFFKVENLNFLNLSYILYDVTGITIMKGQIIDTKSFISLNELASQTYILLCLRGTIEQNVFKIIKIN